MRCHHVTERMYKPLLKRLESPQLSFHDLRHAAATLLLKAGVPVKMVSEMLGHASVAFTLETYAYVLLDVQRDAAAAAERLFADHALGS